MLYLIDPDNYHLHTDDLNYMYRLRHTVFFEHEKWNITTLNGTERDHYDEKNAYYLIYKDPHGIIRGCVRFIEMIHDCMFDDPFKHTLPNLEDYKKPNYWELSRLAVDQTYDTTYTPEMARNIHLNLMTGYLYFALEIEEIECTLSVTYPKTLALYKSHGLLISEINKLIVNEQTHEELIVSAFPSLTYCYTKMAEKIKLDPNKPVLWNLMPLYKHDSTYFTQLKHVMMGS